MKTPCPVVHRLLGCGLPVPVPARALIRFLYRGGVVAAEGLRWLYGGLVAAPVMRSIAEVQGGLRIERIPYVRGRGRIVLGPAACLSGKIGIMFSRHGKVPPTLRVGEGTFLGHGCSFAVAESVEIGRRCLLANGVAIQDHDGHPLDPARRAAGLPADPADVRPVVVEDDVWIGRGAIVLKGVRIGRNAVVGAGAVVTHDLPADSVAAGNPARVIRTLP